MSPPPPPPPSHPDHEALDAGKHGPPRAWTAPSPRLASPLGQRSSRQKGSRELSWESSWQQHLRVAEWVLGLAGHQAEHHLFPNRVTQT